MQCIHASHLGVEGCLRRARECVYWQGMNEQIKTYVQQCDTCRAVDCNQQKETLRPHDMPDRPWAKVGTDLFTFDNKDYLITVDYYSNFWEIDYLTDTKSATVIRKLKGHFARQGIPDIVISDNGPQFSSQEFQKFSHHWAFLHKTSSPGYPQSNGKAESAVKTAKRLMLKARMSRQDPYLAILDHRNTPTHGLSTSPAQRLLSRRTRTLLPTKTSLLQPKIQDSVRELTTNQQRQLTYYNRSAKDLDMLKQGDPVRIQPFEPHKIWRKGTVVEPIDLRSYSIQLDSGGVIRRNRRHLRRDHGTPRVSHQPETVVPDNTKHAGTADAQPQTSNNVENQMKNTEQSHIPASVVTKSGRLIKKPQYLKDYIT
uniref:Gypsy retrotransposon integrase-like protein 1 n=1 Tax=Paramormyrops kingsleyae TaxID=1676925 RepID=A0A3B3RV52_9TELE